MTANPTQRRRGGSRTRPLYEGVDPEIAFIRVKLQSSLQYDPGNRRVIMGGSRTRPLYEGVDPAIALIRTPVSF